MNRQLLVDAAAVAVAVGDAAVVGSCDHHVTQTVEQLPQQMGGDGDPSGKAWGRDNWHHPWVDRSSASQVFLHGHT